LNSEIPAAPPRLIGARSGFSVLYHDKFLLSRVDPVRQAERAALAALPLAPRTLYLIPSPLLGYGIPLIIAALPPDSALLCVEADAALAELSREHIAALQAASDSRLSFVRTAKPNAVCAFVNQVWGRRRFRRVEIIRLSGGWQLNAGFYEAAAEALRTAIATDWYNAITLSKLGRLYIKNAIRNLPLLARGSGIENLDFGSRPVVVFGAGPSFDTFFDSLGRAMLPEACVKVCVDTALRPLLERNVEPDLVVALDAQHWNLRDFCGAGCRRLPVAMDMSAPPAVSGVLGGDSRIFWTRWTDLGLFERLTALNLMPLELPPLGSVGLSAVNLALRLGSGPVFTVGIDLAFTLDKYHCRGSPSHGEILRRHNRFGALFPASAAFRQACTPVSSSAEGEGGLVWRDDPVMRRCRSLFDDEFAGTGRVFAVEGGAYLGVETLSPEAALEKIYVSAAHCPGSVPAVCGGPGGDQARAVTLLDFIKNEEAVLGELLGVLKGEREAARERLDSLLDSAGYLWAHFPDCAGAGGRRPSSGDIVFLRRVRAEIEPFIRLWESARRRIMPPV
jgi:hypothetical protein